MSSAWNEYSSDTSDCENDAEIEGKVEPIVNEAVKLLFLRRYSSINISEEELIKVFQECNYRDNEIQRRLSDRMKSIKVPYVIIEKPFEKSKANGYGYGNSNSNTNGYGEREEGVSNDKHHHKYNSNYHNKKEYYHKKGHKHHGWNDDGQYSNKGYGYCTSSYVGFGSSNYKSSSFPYKPNNKKHYRNNKVKQVQGYYGNEVNSDTYYQIEKEIELTDKQDTHEHQCNYEVDIGEHNQDIMKVSQTFSKISTISESSVNNDKDKETTPSMSAIASPLSIKRTTSEVISELTPKPKDDNSFLTTYTNYFFDTGSNYIRKEPQLYESKLFPGVYFTKPIEPREKKEEQTNNNWKSVFNYYSPLLQPQN